MLAKPVAHSGRPPVDAVLAALDHAPEGEPFTADERAELDNDMAQIAAGRARVVAHDDLVDALVELAAE